MDMPKKYTDYFHDTILTIPENFINVKTGETEAITSKIQDQIAYHSKNNTLIHLVFSALHDYFHGTEPVHKNMASDAILEELLELKRMLLQDGYDSSKSLKECPIVSRKEPDHTPVELKDIEDLLEAFGG
jgi:hypothetical protein